MKIIWLFYRARQYDIRGKGYLRTTGKYYIVEWHYAVSQRRNYAGQLENIVYVELLRRGSKVDVGKLQSREIDFIARKHDEIIYIRNAEIPMRTIY